MGPWFVSPQARPVCATIHVSGSVLSLWRLSAGPSTFCKVLFCLVASSCYLDGASVGNYGKPQDSAIRRLFAEWFRSHVVHAPAGLLVRLTYSIIRVGHWMLRALYRSGLVSTPVYMPCREGGVGALLLFLLSKVACCPHPNPTNFPLNGPCSDRAPGFDRALEFFA